MASNINLTGEITDFILLNLPAYWEKTASDAASSGPPPFVLGVSGIQGSGKTHLAARIEEIVKQPPFNMKPVVLSIDDLYKTYAEQKALAASHPTNPLLQHRGQPGTHDLELGAAIFDSLFHHRPTRIPSYDKSARDGQGDRTDPGTWTVARTLPTEEYFAALSTTPSPMSLDDRPVDMIIFEGWCVGFRALAPVDLERLWAASRAKQSPTSKLWRHDLKDLELINNSLLAYDVLTDKLDALIHLFVHLFRSVGTFGSQDADLCFSDAKDTQNVYDWRLEQEAALRQRRGAGMTDEQVRAFVDGYYPAYELYLEPLRQGGAFQRGGHGDDHGQSALNLPSKQLRILIDQHRKPIRVKPI
ncbi:MAG: hypothetical protein M1838_004069 [Thelocarpon superellum]|nr:MAG: hypothetical protein M1838_004069 [Thelocarpon superellum]